MKLSTAVLFISAVSAANAANTNIRGATDDDRKLQPVDPTAAVDPAANTNIRGNSIEEIIDGKMDKSRGITWNSIGRVTRWLADVITDDSSVVIPTNSTTDGTDVKPTDGGDVTPVIPSDGGDVTPVKPPDGGDVTPVKPDDGGDVTPVKPDDGGDVTPVKPDDGGDVTPVKPDDGGDVPLEPEADTWGPTQEDGGDVTLVDPAPDQDAPQEDHHGLFTSGDESPVPKVYKEVYEKEIRGKKYKVDERPDCIPGHMKSALTSELSKEMHKSVVSKTRGMWTDKNLTPKAREIKVKGKKASMEALEVSIKADMAGAGTAVHAAPIHAASVLCDIADADFPKEVLELTKMLAKREYMDEQIVANCEDAQEFEDSLEKAKLDTRILLPLVKEEAEEAEIEDGIAAAVQPDPEVTQF